MQPVSPDAYYVVTLAIISTLLYRLIDRDIVPRDEILADLRAIAEAKAAKGALYGVPAETEAATLATVLATDIAQRFSN
jgi:hypothetical protein